jgi:magnesium-transporting ATPase (P-type)
VEVPSESGASTSQPSDDSVHNGSKWGRMLQSPSLLAEKTASFTAKLAGGLTGKSRGAGAKRPIQPRASVNPRQRAAQDAQYRTVLSLKQEAAAAAGSPQAGGGGARGGGGGGGKDAGVRDVHFAPQGAPGPPPLPETNRVVTSKYNVVTFLPIFLFEMFSRVAYLYFLLQAGLSWWSVVSPYSGVGSTAALLFVLAVAAVKAIWEDVKRHQEDQRMNTSVTHRLNPDGSVTDVAWTDVAVGDAIVVRDDENFPADLLCLRSALPDNVCFIRTTNLDGETNLKIRKPLDVKGLRLASMPEVMTLDLTLKAEAPNKNLHKFRGKAVVRNQAYADMPISPGSDRMLWEAGGGGGGGGAPDGPAPPAPPTPSVEVAVTMNEMLLRGCTLKNSGEIVGLVVYTGKQTRIQMNATKTPLKIGGFPGLLLRIARRMPSTQLAGFCTLTACLDPPAPATTPLAAGSFDRFLNFQITLVIIMQLAMCLFLAVANYIWQRRVGRDHPYLALDADVQGIYANGLLQVVINFLTFWILLSYLVPISLFVTLEIVKFWQGFVFINLDKGLRDPATGEYARCRNSNLNEDLGKVEYVFSDKTGTLTSNEMQLRQLSIKGEVFGSAAFRLEDHPALAGAEALRRFDRRLAAAAAAARAAPGWDSLVVGGGSAARLMAYHSSNPSYGTAASAGLARAGRGASATLDDFDPSAPDDGAAPAPRATLALGHHLVDFFTNLLICQSLILDEDEAGGPPRYQGPSPDEVALVEAARQVGFVFQSRSQTGVSLSMLGKEVAYEVLNVMEYSSERGCMSVVARCPDGTVRLYCKGADAKVMRKVRGSTDPALVARSEDNLHTFARAGLRTLVLASKVIPEAAYREWDARFQEASRLFEGRDAALDGLGNEIERDLELIGVTAIEDKLQEGVPAAIKTLLAANVRVWMITGDKQETAVNIAVSCDLVRDVDGVMVLNVDEKAEGERGRGRGRGRARAGWAGGELRARGRATPYSDTFCRPLPWRRRRRAGGLPAGGLRPPAVRAVRRLAGAAARAGAGLPRGGGGHVAAGRAGGGRPHPDLHPGRPRPAAAAGAGGGAVLGGGGLPLEPLPEGGRGAQHGRVRDGAGGGVGARRAALVPPLPAAPARQDAGHRGRRQ